MDALTPDLFGGHLLPGLELRENLIDAREQAVLVSRIDAETLSPFRFQGWLGNRLTHSFGWHYDFDRGSFGRSDPIPDWLLPLRQSVAASFGLDEASLEQALLIRYDAGAGIGWHRDRPVFEHVVGISLGAPATMRFRRRRAGGFDRASAPLAPRSAYRMSGEARHEWEHSIVEMDETRWSVTFRTFAEGAVADGR